ncbi:hypothetical protein WN51_07095 [Melipona quadrifasciata]|uniref:Uncharacterized protein n=1 Tax=Melipona quadrifasciata TaxID=166423 RepID=A0A0M8ZQG4_9HYME|nr:hypothetical protein WN51_07095 [Melipona quadrifasciata]
MYKIAHANMGKQQNEQSTTVRDTEFESDDSVCLGNIEEQFQRLCASEIESSEDSENVVAMTPTAVPSYLVRETKRGNTKNREPSTNLLEDEPANIVHATGSPVQNEENKDRLRIAISTRHHALISKGQQRYRLHPYNPGRYSVLPTAVGIPGPNKTSNKEPKHNVERDDRWTSNMQ